jgi:hypothetical protein
MFGRLYFDRELINFLNITSNSKISMIFLNASGSALINEEGNFIKRDKNDIDLLSYYPISKINSDKTLDYFKEKKNRVSIKIGRFVRKFLSEQSFRDFNISDKDIESFVNLFKSYFTPDKNNLIIVEGDEIKKWYSEENYATTCGLRTGSLWNSCMRQVERNKFMELYSVNSNLCKMLIFLTDEGKLRSRALLWEDVVDTSSGFSYKVMDRIYSIYDHDVYLFKSWAKENGYITKLEQSAKTELFFDNNGTTQDLRLKIKLDKHNLVYYPYLDTFKFFDPINGELLNYSTMRTHYKLVQSNGMLEPPPRNEEDDEFEDIGWEDDELI